MKTFSDLYNAQFKYLREQRGFDEVELPTPYDANSYGMGGVKKKIPRTTNTDVLALAGYWGKELENVKEVIGHEGDREAMEARDRRRRRSSPCTAATRRRSTPKNNAFWRACSDTAIHVSVADEAPSKWDMAKAALKDSITHLPENLEHGASAVAKLVASAAHAVGKVANEAGKGLFAGFGTPLLIGGGLIGLFLITRNRGEKKEA